MKISFMTLGCPALGPGYDLPRGRAYGFDGVDFRGTWTRSTSPPCRGSPPEWPPPAGSWMSRAGGQRASVRASRSCSAELRAAQLG